MQAIGAPAGRARQTKWLIKGQYKLSGLIRRPEPRIYQHLYLRICNPALEPKLRAKMQVLLV